MQGLADGYFILPYTIGDYLADEILTGKIDTKHAEFEQAEKEVDKKIQKLLSVKGEQTVDSIHKKLGHIMWDYVGMSRNEEGLKKAIDMIEDLRNEFWKEVKVPGKSDELNVELEKAGRVADFLELGELMARDALDRNESCGGHYREESTTEEGEAKRDDENFTHSSVWKYRGDGQDPELIKEKLEFENVKLTQRSYK
jgi:succinate dehydrogenase / fumarate reductase, flavoprotein subunit